MQFVVRSLLLIVISLTLALHASAGAIRPQIGAKAFERSQPIYGYPVNGGLEFDVEKRANAEMVRFLNQLSHLEPYQLVVDATFFIL